MPGTELNLPPPFERNAPNLADWAEAALFAEQRREISRADLRSRLKAAVPEDEDEDGDTHGEVETELDLLLGEIAARRKCAPNAYPFDTDRTSRIWIDARYSTAPYEFLLWASVSEPLRADQRFDEVRPLFEELVLHTLLELMGRDAAGLRFGCPPSEDRPDLLVDAVSWLAERLGCAVGSETAPATVADEGVDVVCWRAFRDGHAGFAIVLCHCEVAPDLWWEASIPLERWRNWIDFGMDPIRALAVPFAVDRSSQEWDAARRVVHILLDRARLCELM